MNSNYLYYPRNQTDAKICKDSIDGRHAFFDGAVNCEFCGFGGVIADGEVLYVPTEKALEYHQSEVPNLLFYGGRGSAKSTTARWDAHIRALAHENYRYVILRRTYPELHKSHISFMKHEMSKLGGQFNSTEKLAYYPNGSRGYFAMCQGEEDVLKLLGSEFALAVFDELTTFDWEHFQKLSSSVRVPVGAGYKALVRGLTNPLGPSAVEVMRHFVSKDIELSDNPDYIPDDWQAIKANLIDNPFLPQEYLKRFSGLGIDVRKAWIDGDFSNEGSLFDFRPLTKEGAPWHVINELPEINGRPLLWLRN